MKKIVNFLKNIWNFALAAFLINYKLLHKSCTLNTYAVTFNKIFLSSVAFFSDSHSDDQFMLTKDTVLLQHQKSQHLARTGTG